MPEQLGSAGQVWIVCAVLAWEAAVEQLFTPAQLAFIPTLVPEDRLVAANALNGQVSDVSRLAGSGLGGLIAALRAGCCRKATGLPASC